MAEGGIRERRPREERVGQCCAGRVGEGRGRNGVLSDTHGREEREENVKGEGYGGEAIEEVEDRDAFAADLGGIGGPREVLELGFDRGVLGGFAECENTLGFVSEERRIHGGETYPLCSRLR